MAGKNQNKMEKEEKSINADDAASTSCTIADDDKSKKSIDISSCSESIPDDVLRRTRTDKIEEILPAKIKKGENNQQRDDKKVVPEPSPETAERNDVAPSKSSAQPKLTKKGKAQKNGNNSEKSGIIPDSVEPIKKEKRKKKEPVRSMKITDFFPVRRSGRKTESEIKKEKADELADAILSEKQDGLEITVSPVKGRGIIATKPFQRGDFVVEYKGEILSREEGFKRNDEYAKDESIGSYLYYFECGNTQYCVDATAESKYYGRLINHSAKKPNLLTKAVQIGRNPHLILVAKRKIKVGEELLYDYGERNSDTVSSNPWLKDS